MIRFFHTIARLFENIACFAGFHVYTRWMDNGPHDRAKAQTRYCRVCGCSQVRSRGR